MRVVFTVPVTVGCDARDTDTCPGRLHLNACVCGRIESVAGRMSGDRGMRVGGLERACGARANHNHSRRKPLGHLGMSRGDGRFT
jgi:hypothetical protein